MNDVIERNDSNAQLVRDAQALAVAGMGAAFLPPFAGSDTGTMGIELELMVLDRLTYDLMPAAPDILRLLEGRKKAWAATPEITTSMLDVATSVLRKNTQAHEQQKENRTTERKTTNQVGVA